MFKIGDLIQFKRMNYEGMDKADKEFYEPLIGLLGKVTFIYPRSFEKQFMYDVTMNCGEALCLYEDEMGMAKISLENK